MIARFSSTCACGARIAAGDEITKIGRRYRCADCAADGGDGYDSRSYKSRFGRCEDAPCCGCCGQGASFETLITAY